jgi:hypothetical protein
MSSDTDNLKRADKDDITFAGNVWKTSFGEFDKYMFRYMKMRNGQTIGEGL